MRKVLVQVLFFVLFFIQYSFAQSISYSSLYDNTSFPREIDLSKPVGTLEGVAGANQNGAITYTIPIKCPSGTNDVMPNLSVTYSSQGENGVLGWGWNVSGLSTITRTGQDIYHDGKVNPVTYTNQDVFALDGMRLSPKSGSNGSDGTIYRTESEAYSVITSYGSVGGGPEKFKILSKEGTIMEYGYTTDARFLTNDASKVMFWRLNKIQDVNGNYVEFIYNNSDRDSRISQIKYTGNAGAGLLPYNVINFQYATRSDQNTSYDCGNSVSSKYLLWQIQVMGEDDIFKTYQFYFGKNYTQSSYLKQVEEFAGDGSVLNDTRFQYGDNTAEISDYTDVTIKSSGSDLAFAASNFNGDGIADLFVAARTDAPAPINLPYDLFYLNMIKPTTATAYTTSSSIVLSGSYSSTENMFTQRSHSTIVPADYDGDGIDDVIMSSIFSIFDDIYYAGTVLYYINSTGGMCCSTAYLAPNHATPVEPTPEPYNQMIRSGDDKFNYFYSGDFNGDGAADYITVLSNNGLLSNVYFSSPKLGISNQRVSVPTSVFHSVGVYGGERFSQADVVHVINFDGDTKSDLMIVEDDITRVFTFNFGELMSITMDQISGNMEYPTTWHDILLGDFNGDGKTDILTGPQRPGSTLTSLWHIGYSNGKEFLETDFNFDHLIKQFKKVPGLDITDVLTVGDFNGDGKSDIYDYYNNGTTKEHNVYISTGTQFYHKKQATTAAFGVLTVGDFNGDGKSEILSTNITGNVVFTRFNAFGKSHLLSKVNDGYNRTTEFGYEVLTKGTGTGTGDFYTKGTGETYPVNNVQIPMYVAISIKSPDGKGDISTVRYKYENQRLHRAGRGLLGFEKVTAFNDSTDIRVVSIYDIDRTYYVPYLKTTKTFVHSTNFQLTQQDDSYVFSNISGYCYFQKNNSTVKQDLLTGTSTTTDNSYDAAGNIMYTESTTTGGETLFSSTAIQYFTIGGSGVPNKPNVIVRESQRGSLPKVTTHSFFTYNTRGLVTETYDKPFPYSGSDFFTETYEYDAYGNVTKQKKTALSSLISAFPETLYEYESKGRFVTKQTNSFGDFKTFTTHKFWGKPLTITGENGLTTTNTYDVWGKTQTTSVPVTASSTYQITYSDNWDIVPSTNALYYTYVDDPTAPNVKTWYDNQQRPVKESKEAFGGAYASSFTTYNGKGKVASATNYYLSTETPLLTTHKYDVMGRLWQTNSPAGLTAYFYLSGSGLETTTVTLPDLKVQSRTKDALGNLVKSTNGIAGTIVYTYDSRGKEIKSAMVNSSGAEVAVLVKKEYDVFGRLKKITDQDAGSISYTYDPFGRMVTQTDPAGKITTFKYDVMNRLTEKKLDIFTTNYSYYNKLKNYQLHNTTVMKTTYSETVDEYDYDVRGVLIDHQQVLGGDVLQKKYYYDGYGRLDVTEYVNSGFKTKNHYDVSGHLKKITTFLAAGVGEKTLYEALAKNGDDQITHYKRMDGLTAEIFYDRNLPTRYLTPDFQDLFMSYNYTNGNMISRKDNRTTAREHFTYDAADRLIRAKADYGDIAGMGDWPAIDMTYDNNPWGSFGRIMSKSDVGAFSYSGFPRNAVKSVTDPSGQISHITQNIEYTAFHKVSKISENRGGFIASYNQTFVYDANEQRSYSEIRGLAPGPARLKRRYMGNFEINQDISASSTKMLHYISGDDGLCGIVVHDPLTGTYSYYAVYTDHLGSIVGLTQEVGGTVDLVTKISYDPWGRERNPTTWDYSTHSYTKPEWLYRGYTGQEMLPEFQLINLNGRMYDPMNGRMLRPDNYVTYPDNTQSYNRYSYALNNPLKFTDPDGNHPILIALAVGFTVGAIKGGVQAHNAGGDVLDGVVRGATYGTAMAMLTSTVGFGIGQAFGGIGPFVTSTGGANWGAVANEAGRAAAHGASSYVMSGFKTSAFFSGALGSVAGSVTFGMGGPVGSALKTRLGGTLFAAGVGGASSKIGGGSFIDGAVTAATIHLVNHEVHKGEGKGNTFRGGSKKSRDGDMTKYPNDFKDWYHRNKEDYVLPGEPDPELEPIYQEWEELGKPKNFQDIFNVQKAINTYQRYREMFNPKYLPKPIIVLPSVPAIIPWIEGVEYKIFRNVNSGPQNI
jgi:RHS repeat-associated protein